MRSKVMLNRLSRVFHFDPVRKVSSTPTPKAAVVTALPAANPDIATVTSISRAPVAPVPAVEAEEPKDNLVNLAAQIYEAAKAISAHLKQKNLEVPTTAVNSPSLPRDPEIFELRKQLVAAADQLAALATYEAAEPLKFVLWGFHESAALKAVTYFNVAKTIPDDGTAVHIDDIAEQLQFGAAEKAKILACMRMVAQRHIFTEVEPGKFAHTKYSQLLKEENTQNFILCAAEEMYKSSICLPESMEKWPGSTAPANSPFNVAFNTEKTFFQFQSEDKARYERFNKAMAGSARGGDAVLTSVYPWKKLGSAKMVDIGGGAGFVATAIARAAPGLQITVQDQEKPITHGRRILPEDLKQRVEFVEANFFKPQTMEAEVYFLRMIVHDYSDDIYANIIRNIMPMMKPGKKIILGETVYKPCANSAPTDRMAMQLNMGMMALFNGQVRSFFEHEQIFKSVDPRFVLKQYGEGGPTGCEIIEATLGEE